MIELIQQMLAPLSQRVRLMISRAIITLVNDESFLQTMQVQLLAGETRDGLLKIQQYGFTSVPLPGAEAVAVFPGGNRANGIVIGVEDRRYRLQGLEGGEVALYTDEGDQILFARGKQLQVTSGGKVIVTAPEVDIVASSLVSITSPQVTMTGNLTVEGSLTVDENITADGDITGENVTATVALEGASVTAAGAISGGTVAAGGVTLAAIKTDYDGHTHVAPSGGGTTSGPSTTI